MSPKIEYKAEAGDADPKAPTAAEVKAVLDGIGKTVADLRKTNDELQSKAAAGEGGIAELKAKIDKINGDLTGMLDLKARADALEAAIKRMPTGGTAQGQPAETKAVADYKAALRHFIQRGEAPHGSEAMADLQRKALSVGIEPNGGYFVTPDMSGRMVEFVRETSPLRALAAVQTIGSDSLEGFYDDDETSTGAEWEEETETNSNTATPTIGKWSIPVHYLRARPKATQKMLDDSQVNIEQWLTGKVSKMFGYKEGTAFVVGTGIKQPRGFMTYAHATSYGRSTIQQVNVADGGSPVGLSADGIINLVYALKGIYRNRATFVANRSTWGTIRLLKDQNDQYLWQPSYQMGQPDRLLGVATAELADVADISSNALCMAIAAWSDAYQIVDRDGFSVLRDPYTVKPYVEFYCRRRVGGAVINTDAIKIGKYGTP